MKKVRRLDCIRGVVALCVFAILISFGCGGGGGGSPETANSEAAGSRGKVGILLTDGPTDEYEHIWVTITEVSLLPAGGDHGVVIFSSDEGYRFDLLAYRDEDFLLKLSENVPVGKYEKIRLRVLKVEAKRWSCSGSEEIELDVPSGKIDLNPRGSFEVKADATLYIRLDIDADKSFNISNGDKFRPVVFVDIVSMRTPPECPIFMKGEVSALDDANGDAYPESFTLLRNDEHCLGNDGCLGSVDVLITEDTPVFRENGTFGSAIDIRNGQKVIVRGRVGDGCIVADLIIIGNILPVCGTVRGPVCDSGFVLEPFTGEWLLGNPEVILDALTPVVSGCNTPVPNLAEGMHVTILGKYDMASGRLYAAIVLVKPNERSGTINTVESVEGGYCFTVTFDGGGTEEIFIPSATRIFIEGDGLFPDDEDMVLLLGLHPYRVKVIQRYSGALELKIVPDRVAGRVSDLSGLFERTLAVYDESYGCDVEICIMPLATGIDTTGDGDCLITPSDIDEEDMVTCFGFWKGPDVADGFLAFAFIVDDKVLTAD